MTEQQHTVCRTCHIACDLLVKVKNGEVEKIYGDKNNPIYHGYSCIKGRVAGEALKSSERLVHSQERQPDGRYQSIESGRSVTAIATRLQQIIDQHGPRSVALFSGTYCTINLLFEAFAKAFMRGIDSPMVIDNITIDQSGRSTAPRLLGSWLAGAPAMDQWDALLLVGSNPLVSMNGGLGMNPARRLKRLRARGMKLVVVDPRRTECAAQADVHLQAKPGEDVTILAGLIRQLFVDGQLDHDFIAYETQGVELLRQAVSEFTPEVVAKRAGIAADDLVKAARILGSAKKGATSFGTGAHMSGQPTVIEYLGRVLTSLRGWWRRVGEEVCNPGVFFEPLAAIAGTMGPTPLESNGIHMFGRGIKAGSAGIPVSALADEILTNGEGKIRALIVAGANPVLAWPDQAKTVQALADLDLLVCIDPVMSATAEMADYILAPKMGLECETNSSANEKWALGGPGWGYDKPYGQVAPAVVETPAGSDLKEDWEFFFELAQEMGVPLTLPALSTIDPEQSIALGTELDMARKPSTSEAWRIAFKRAPVAYDAVAALPNGRLIERQKVTVQAKPEDWTGRLELAAAPVMEKLTGLAADIAKAQPRRLASRPPSDTNDPYPFRLISRRLNDIVNSCGHSNPKQLRKWPYNPAFMHPSDLTQLEADSGSLVQISSAHGQIIAVAESDESVRPGCVSMAHSWGRHPDHQQRPQVDGANTGCLLSVDEYVEEFTGQPLMSAVPIAVNVY